MIYRTSTAAGTKMSFALHNAGWECISLHDYPRFLIGLGIEMVHHAEFESLPPACPAVKHNLHGMQSSPGFMRLACHHAEFEGFESFS